MEFTSLSSNFEKGRNKEKMRVKLTFALCSLRNESLVR